MKNDSQATIKLYIPEPTKHKRQSDHLGYDYNKEELIKLVTKLRKPLANAQVTVYDHEGYRTTCGYVKRVMESAQQQKGILQDFAALMLGDLRNFTLYINSLPEQTKLVYKMLLRGGMCLLSEVKKMMGIKELEVDSRSRYYGWGRPEKLDLLFLSYHSTYDEHYNLVYYVGVEESYREWLYEALLPEERLLVMVDELPEGLSEGCFELSTITHMPVALALMEQGVLDRGANKFSAASVKKGVRQLGVEEFFSGLGIPRQMETMRGAIMLQTLGTVWGNKSVKDKRKSFENRIKTMLMLLREKSDELYPILMGYLTGLRPSQYDYLYGADILEDLCISFPEWESGKWIEVNSIIRRLFLSTARSYYLDFFSEYNYDRVTIYNKFGDESCRIKADSYVKEIGIPFVRGLFFMLAAWGLFDIGCREFDLDDISPYDTLEYVRLTPLGAYVLEQSDTYEMPQTDADVAYFELDPNRLIIRSLSADNPYESLLTDTCTSIGNRRYRMTAESFLAHCSSKEDVEGKIDFFKRYISGDLTPVWTDFFDSLLKRCKPLTQVPVNDYLLFKVSSDNLPLIHLLSNDATLRQLVIRAENFIFLVPKINKAKFDHRLKSLGYLL